MAAAYERAEFWFAGLGLRDEAGETWDVGELHASVEVEGN